MDKLRIAVAKGSLWEPVIERLEAAGFDIEPLRNPGRRLQLETAEVEYVISRAVDVPTFVEWGAVDIGFVGSDILMEEDYDVFELLDLAIGQCRFVLAGRAEAAGAAPAPGRLQRVATKYPKVAADYLERCGRQAEIIKLYGSMELAPLVGLADEIIDLSSTGRTLADNGLVVIDEIVEVSCRLIANYVSYKMKSSAINELVNKVKNAC